MKGIIYTRVSSDEQIKGTSLDDQEAVCRKYCDDKGIEIMEVFREEGASAKTADREEFLRAIEYCRKNKKIMDVFVVAKVDRFARNTEDHFGVRKILIDYGVSLHSVTEPIGNTPVEKFIETVLAGNAELDNSTRSYRCVRGMRARLKQGIYPWRPPIGYVCSHFKRQGLKKNEPDPPDGRIFTILQKGLREYARGSVSQVELTALYDKWGLGSLRGKKTTSKFVNGLLTKHLDFYAGILKTHLLEEEIEGLHEPMITKDEYYRIRLILSGSTEN
jgi:DNA invertase Pin-like site-specific DNA recombinase